MKIRAIAINGFVNLLRNKLILLFSAAFLCILMLFMTPLLMVKSAASTVGAGTAAQLALSEITVAMTLMSGFGSLLAAWAAADAAASEVRSGTILAVLARPVRRWEFLLGKYLGVMMLMAIYAAFLLGMTYLLTAISGQKVQSSPVPLVGYLLARYAIYAAIGMLLGVLMHPVLAFGVVLVIAELASMVAPGQRPEWMPIWIRGGLYVILPSTHLLSEDRFLQIAQASIRGATLTEHLTSLTYGLDYAAVCFLLSAWAFRRKSLTRE
jgi:ABC-type transport system involved in multi-copper enzyme maturation permease subunit